jgi:hypothetical protein
MVSKATPSGWGYSFATIAGARAGTVSILPPEGNHSCLRNAHSRVVNTAMTSLGYIEKEVLSISSLEFKDLKPVADKTYVSPRQRH